MTGFYGGPVILGNTGLKVSTRSADYMGWLKIVLEVVGCYYPRNGVRAGASINRLRWRPLTIRL